jgi:hypothetical protein
VISETISPDLRSGLHVDGARNADDIVLIDAVSRDSDGADEDPVLVERETTGKNRDAVREIRVSRKEERRSGGPAKRDRLLESEVRPMIRPVDSRWIEPLREEADAAAAHGQLAIREEERSPRFLCRDVQTEDRCFAGTKDSKDWRWFTWFVIPLHLSLMEDGYRRG